MIGQEIIEKQYVAVGKASTFVSLRPKGTIMVDGSTSIAPLMEVINVCTVAQLRTSLLLKSLEGRSDLIAKEIHRLAAYDKEKDTQYCETLYRYLTCCRSLKKTCDALFAHRNTVLYRIRRIRDDFNIPLDDPAVHADLLLGSSLLLFEEKGPDFFMNIKNNREE